MAQGRISERGRLEVKFRVAPPVKTRARLHDAGFTWSPASRLWWAERDPVSDALYKELVKAKPRRWAGLARNNPDWSALARQSGELAVRGAKATAKGASRAAAWTAPRLRRGAEATWDGAKRAAKATARGARKATRAAAPHVVRGMRSGADKLERWAKGLRENPAGSPAKRLDWTVTGRGRGREYILSVTRDGDDEPLAYDSGRLASVAPTLNLANAASRADFAQGMVFDWDLNPGDTIQLWASDPSPKFLDGFAVNEARAVVRPKKRRGGAREARGTRENPKGRSVLPRAKRR